MISYKYSSYLKKHITRQRDNNLTVGFIPTMGALHKGHMSLIEAAKKECDIVVCSIFVNPTQFNNPEDLVKYPRTEVEDKSMLEAHGCDIVFTPSVKEMYPKGMDDFEVPAVGEMVSVLEGKHRPGHFEGMMQIVSLLLDKVNPTHLYMGLKDYQQFAICCKMVELQGRDVTMRGMPIVREKNGLAMSSRNKRLSKKAKEGAKIVHESLLLIKKNLAQKSIEELKQMALQNIETFEGAKMEYFEIVDQKELVYKNSKEELIALTAVWLEDVRLIDNMILN